VPLAKARRGPYGRWMRDREPGYTLGGRMDSAIFVGGWNPFGEVRQVKEKDWKRGMQISATVDRSMEAELNKLITV
jgi:hypothetical protein